MAETNTVENAKDSFYQLFVSATNTSSSFKKIERLTSCGVPSEAKVLDDITATDDRRQVNAVVDYKENSEVEFEYVLLPEDETHKLLQKSFESGRELYFQLKFVKASSESRKFTGLISKLSVDNEDTKKKLRKTATIAITGDVSKITE